MSLSQREQLERMPLTYDVVVRRGREIVYRTVAIGEFAQVQIDVHHLGAALSATSIEYTRRKQTTPAPPAGAPQWWRARLGQSIDAGVTYTLPIRGAAPEPESLALAGGVDP